MYGHFTGKKKKNGLYNKMTVIMRQVPLYFLWGASVGQYFDRIKSYLKVNKYIYIYFK